MKNQNGFGSIVCLDPSGKKRRKPWAVRITAGWKDGKQVRKYLGYYETQTDALIALADYHKNGVDVDLTKLTLVEVYEQWYKQIEDDISASATRVHRMTYDRLGTLGKRKIKDIKSAHLQEWMKTIDLKPGSKKKIRSTLVQVFDYAVDNDIVMKNYAKSINIKGETEKTGNLFTEEEIIKLWKNAHDPMVQYTLILIYTGMRIGELLQLPVKDINFQEKYATGGIKSKAGKNRVIPFHDDIIDFVKDRAGKNYLLENKYGNPINYTTAKTRFKNLMESLDMEHNFHDTRKTAISMMHSSGIPIEVIRVIVGHSAKGVTEKVYLYKHPKELVEAVNKMQVKKK